MGQKLFLFKHDTNLLRRIAMNMIVYGCATFVLACVMRVFFRESTLLIVKISILLLMLPLVVGPILLVLASGIDVVKTVKADFRRRHRLRNRVSSAQRQLQQQAMDAHRLWTQAYKQVSPNGVESDVTTIYSLTEDGKILRYQQIRQTDIHSMRLVSDERYAQELSFERFHEMIRHYRTEEAERLSRLTPETWPAFLEAAVSQTDREHDCC